MSDAASREQTDTETDAGGHGLRVPFSEDDSSSAHDSSHAHANSSARRATAARKTLVAAITIKLALDLLFVCALAVYTQAVSLRADFEGALEYADGRAARGWVRDSGGSTSDSVELQLYVDGRFAAAGRSASRHAPGAATDGRLGFELSFGPLPPGEHEARVYAVSASRGGTRRTLRQLGGPLRFVVQ
ncbi:MAG TPA: hypothetical protein VJ866_14890 [Pyrinomonadaceae bacterium]|nr:hypothetical protein [Pyrinomonadaceae bacterium]